MLAVVARNLPANHFQPFLFRILDTFGQVLLLMLVVMLPMVVMLLVLVLHVVHRERHGCIGRRLVQQNGRRWSRGAAGGGHLPNLGHCALVADRTDFVVLLHVSHAGCMSKKVCVCVCVMIVFFFVVVAGSSPAQTTSSGSSVETSKKKEKQIRLDELAWDRDELSGTIFGCHAMGATTTSTTCMFGLCVCVRHFSE